MPARSPSTAPERDPVDAAPPFATAIAALVYVVATFALAYPALSGKFLVSSISDQYLAGYSFRNFGAESLRAGHGFPLWNPYLQGGVPFVAGMGGDIFYPTFLLRMILPTDVAMTWSFIIHYPLAGLFTYKFLRSWRVSFLPSLLGGLAYLMCGPISSYVSPGHDGKLYVSTLLPLALWMVTRGVRDARAWSWGVLAITVGLAVLSPHPQLLQYLLLTTGAFALYISLSAPDGAPIARPLVVRRLALALGAVVLGMLMGAVQYLPVLEYVQWSPRGAGGAQTGWEHATSYSFPPEELLNTYLPEFTGGVEHYWGRNGIHFHSEYLGAALLLLAFAGIGARRWAGRRGFIWFWVGTAIVSILWSLGGYTPFYHIVYALIPGTSFFRAPSTMIYVTAFATCVLAAFGLERLLRREVGERYLVGWAVGALVVAILGAVGGLTGLADAMSAGVARWQAANLYGQPEAWQQIADQMLAPKIQANAGLLALGAWRTFLFVALVAGLGWAAARGKLSARAAGWAILLTVAADFYSEMKPFWRFSPRASQLYGPDPAIEAIKAERQPARVLVVDPAGTRDPMIHGNGLMAQDVRQFLGSHGNELGRFQQYASGVKGGIAPNAWSLYNLKFLLSTAAVPELAAQKVLGPTQTTAMRTTQSTDSIWLYRLPGSNPYAWVAPAVVKAPDDQVLPTVIDQRFDSTYQRRVALAAPDAPLAASGDPNALPQPLPLAVTVTSYAPGRVSMTLDQPAPAGGALVVSENYYPGWTARVDGKAAPVGRVDYTLIGVGLPAGARAVELAFESSRYETGKVVTLVAILTALAAIAAGVLADRRPRAAV